MSSYQLNFALDDYQAADERTEEAFWHAVESEQDKLTPLAEHHTPDGAQSFYVLHNGAVTWGVPGNPQLIALHLLRNAKERSFRFEHAALAALYGVGRFTVTEAIEEIRPPAGRRHASIGGPPNGVSDVSSLGHAAIFPAQTKQQAQRCERAAKTGLRSGCADRRRGRPVP
ncbi:hypothetical protein [Streptomyces incanus]|uniref:Uncharacterized protein n=1 Tax=Streptomyces incanus TaxID=887453 RepID=A0ABW0XYU6_9ACTN